MEFSVIILSKAGDFMVEEQTHVERTDNGVKASQPFIINEDEQAQEIQAEKVFIPYEAVENIQYGTFDHETV
ncbi:MAG: hypothetical protein BRC30_01925 [Nanohaloarchaea archaeon SW_7_46_7]|nr:MAG: hypothetical protein BRC30_01925 [Nanohaloarchaea archaeon SW_7_46_7]